MKKQAYKIFTLIALFLALTAASAQAQSRGTIEVQIPFDFIVGDTHLPAGTYSVKQLSRNDAKALLVRSSQDAKDSAVVITNAVQANTEQTEARLVFHKYGERYFLSQVWASEGRTGRELYESKAERQLAKEQKVAKKETKPETLEVAAHVK